ncbi:DUF456 domain-containing protein [Angustibacter sp. McL0619]|uniref:DUF456 domain-containing protein n=1 Tax=Angustibacter sp. McL0619 TaxID=3415676 RepID=UPI003CE9167D
MTGLDVVVGLGVLVGLAGVVVPVLPGLVLVLGAILVWAIERQDATGWIVLGTVVLLFVVGQIAKYLLPGRRLREAGVPASTMLAGAGLGLVGFFVVPVVGVFLGFVLGVYLAELARARSHARAWPMTLHALRAAGWSILIELAAGLMMAGTWLLGVLV